ncbi:DNA-binding protein [Kitasatospora sp. RB6PN24]|uniref:DNA-binding protein n=1 Tax=Kitasatospora humi TaxID=2893891 RepID=UPI001E410BD9|nr:DNA-binding protein [Kitasatospora humi]MCC9312320.1 DNA-binding protein [Kitasatospora humi]
MVSVVFRVSPIARETTFSLVGRVAARYGLDDTAVLTQWQWRGHRPRHEGGALRADAEMLLDAAGRRMLAGLCGVGEQELGRALPAWGRDDEKLTAGPGGGGPRAVWRVGGAVVGPVAFGCRSCTARRTGAPARVVRYAQRWERVCVRHGQWLLDADADQALEFLDLRAVPELAQAQRRWARVAQRAVRAGVGPGEVFGVAWAVVCRWWDVALGWQEERVWPARLHALAGGDAGGDFWRWRAVARDAAVFPEVVEVARALLDPEMAELVWLDGGAGRPRALPADGAFCQRLGERVGRPWLGPLAAVDFGGPLIAWMGAVIRRRRGVAVPPGYRDDLWWVRRELQPPSMAAQLRALTKEARLPGSGTVWRSAVAPEQRMLIGTLLDDAEEQLLQLRGAQRGSSAEAAERLLKGIGSAAGRLREALREVVQAAVEAGVRVEDVAAWAGLSPDALVEVLGAGGGTVR